MNALSGSKFGVATACLLGLSVVSAFADSADSFGVGLNAFTIDFVSVLNAGNANDTGDGGGIYSSLYGGVAYEFRIGKI